MCKRLAGFVALWLVLVLSLPAFATVTEIAHYRLGENDPSAVAGNVGDNPTVDLVGGLNLVRTDTPTYSADVPPIASTVAMHFDGTDDRYSVSGTVATTLTDNFGLEAWVKSDGNTTGNALIGYNGDTSFGGWGLFRSNASYAVLFGGVTFFGSSPLTPAWTELAIVRNGGVSIFYVNGVANDATTLAPNTPTTSFFGGVMIGGNNNGKETFDGTIDEVRIFSFQPGRFSIADLNLSKPQGAGAPVMNRWGLAVTVLLLLVVASAALRRPAVKAQS